MKNLFRSTRFWVIVFVVLVFVSAGWLMYQNGSAGGTVAVITQDGQELWRIDLDKVEEAYTLRVDSGEGAYNLVLVERGRISITEASCPDKVCIHQGEISNSLTPIVCLPNKVVVAIASSEHELSADAVAG